MAPVIEKLKDQMKGLQQTSIDQMRREMEDKDNQIVQLACALNDKCIELRRANADNGHLGRIIGSLRQGMRNLEAQMHDTVDASADATEFHDRIEKLKIMEESDDVDKVRVRKEISANERLISLNRLLLKMTQYMSDTEAVMDKEFDVVETSIAILIAYAKEMPRMTDDEREKINALLFKNNGHLGNAIGLVRAHDDEKE